MFTFAILVLSFSYLIFFLGLFHMLYPQLIVGSTILFLGFLGIFLKDSIGNVWLVKFEIKEIGILTLILCIGIVNLIGALGPETSFDALWYHLTLPKLYLLQHTISFIPGGLFYYSQMPKLGEMLFVPSMYFGDETGAKLVQLLFGILTLTVIYKVSRKFTSVFVSLLACLIFYSNIVVSWESTVAYIDLIRSFFEILSFYGLYLWYEKKSKKWLNVSAVMIGVAMCVKILTIGSLIISLLLILVLFHQKKTSLGQQIIDISLYIFISFLVVSPWLIVSFINTHNAFYPFFSSIYKTQLDPHIFSLRQALFDFIHLFLYAEDPISPLYLIILPFLVILRKKFSVTQGFVLLYFFASLMLWYVTPRTGGGRFILPYLPVWSVMAAIVIETVKKDRLTYATLIGAAIFIAFITIGYRGIANSRYIPVILGKKTKQAYLSNHLNFSFGDFYDTDDYFKTHMKPGDTVLLYGFHNLYYVDFPFIDSSYVKKGNRFTYVATQNTTVPDRFKDWKQVYKNPKTFVTLYKKGDTSWVY